MNMVSDESRDAQRDSCRVLLGDDHAVVRDGLRHILESMGRFEVVGEAGDGPGVLTLCRNVQADILILDLSMPGLSGFDLISRIRSEMPTLHILVLTMHAEQPYAERAFKAGANGYLTKDGVSRDLVTAVDKIVAGGIYVGPTMAERFAMALRGDDSLPSQRLSNREFEVLGRLAVGQSLGQIAQELCVSVKTVSTYKARLMEKLELPHDAALVRYAIEHGIEHRTK